MAADSPSPSSTPNCAILLSFRLLLPVRDTAGQGGGMMRLALFSSGGEPLGSLALAVPALDATPRGGAQKGTDQNPNWYAMKTTLPTLPGSALCEVSLRIWFEAASYGPMSPLQYSEVVPWESLLDLDQGRAPPGLGDRLLQYLNREPEIEWLLDCGCRDGLLAEVMVYALPCLLEILQGAKPIPNPNLALPP